MDEVHTFNDSRDDLKGQIKFYRENPTFLHPPLFFILTHQFYPFTKPERDLRIIPLIFGSLSIIMIYFLSRAFSPRIALPCTLSLTFMAYHISLSQDGRSYSSPHVFRHGRALLFYEASKNIKENISIPCCDLFCYFIPYELQLHPIYCFFTDSLVLPREGR